jgi:hypothetical protein
VHLVSHHRRGLYRQTHCGSLERVVDRGLARWIRVPSASRSPVPIPRFRTVGSASRCDEWPPIPPPTAADLPSLSKHAAEATAICSTPAERIAWSRNSTPRAKPGRRSSRPRFPYNLQETCRSGNGTLSVRPGPVQGGFAGRNPGPGSGRRRSATKPPRTNRTSADRAAGRPPELAPIRRCVARGQSLPSVAHFAKHSGAPHDCT